MAVANVSSFAELKTAIEKNNLRSKQILWYGRKLWY